MNQSYKIAAILAVLMGGGIFSYHFIQSDSHPSSESAAPPQQPSPSTGRIDNAPQGESPETSETPGIGDLMSRIRTHIDTNTPTDSKEAKNQTPSPTPPQTPAPAEKNQDTPAPNKTDPIPPTLTFSRTPPVDTPPKETATVTLASDSPIEHQRHTPTHSSSNLPSSTPATYTISHGDTFSTIAIKIYGSEQYWTDIALANPFVDPKRLQVGQSIRLPRHDDVSYNANDQPDSLDTADPIIHVVRSGESLYTIAEWYYHDPNLCRIIFNSNREKLGRDPDRLQAGIVLTIPSQHIPAR